MSSRRISPVSTSCNRSRSSSFPRKREASGGGGGGAGGAGGGSGVEDAQNPALVEALRAAVPEGWYACTAEGTRYGMMEGDLSGVDGIHLYPRSRSAAPSAAAARRTALRSAARAPS